MEGTPLLDVMRGLILEPEAQADFAADPSGYMQRFGYDDVPEEDLREAVGLVADTLPPDTAHAVTTAAAAEPSDDAYGEGAVGLLGRISSAEVTESVVPDLDDLPDAAGDPGGDDPFVDDHDATSFGDTDLDDTGDDPDDVGDGPDPADATGDDAPGGASAEGDTDLDDTGDGADGGVPDGGVDDLDDFDQPGTVGADHAAGPAEDAGDLADAAGSDVGFGDGGLDESFDDAAGGPGGAEAFGQGSAPDADADAGPDIPGDGGYDPSAGTDADDDFGAEPSFAPQPDDGVYDDTFDDGAGGYDDAFDDDLGGHGALDTGDGVDDGLDDGDTGDIGDL